jgi:hypothetical protein
MTTHLSSPLRLHADDPDAPSKVAAAVDALLARLEAPRLQVVLHGERLADETIAGLVAGLRRLREKGGAIQVTPASVPVRDALAVAGLDRVFAFPIVPQQPPRRRWDRVLARLTAASFAAVLSLLALPFSAGADPITDPAVILAKVQERNPTLSSFQWRVHVDVILA